jgi:hypothetical protein
MANSKAGTARKAVFFSKNIKGLTTQAQTDTARNRDTATHSSDADPTCTFTHEPFEELSSTATLATQSHSLGAVQRELSTRTPVHEMEQIQKTGSATVTQ